MFAALTAALTGTLHRFAPAWHGGYMVAAAFIIALEACVVQHTFRREHMWLSELSRYLLPELMVMLVIMRVATTLSFGINTLAADARGWLYDPFSIFDVPFLVAIFYGLLVGFIAHGSMQDLLELSPQSFDTPDTLQFEYRATMVAATADRSTALRRISNRFIIGGVLVLLSLGIEAVNVESVGATSLPISRLSAAGALIYLMTGFLLYSQARLALLRARWQLDGATVAPAVITRWTRTSWMIIGSVVLLAVLLPRTYGMGLLDTIRSMLGVVGYIFAILGYVVIWLFGMLALIPAWLMSLFATNDTATPPPAEPPPFMPPAPPPAVHEPQLLATSIFWVCMLLLAVYALWIVVQRHPELFRAITMRGPLRWLLQRLGIAWRDTRSWAQQAATVVQERLRRPNVGLRPPRRWMSLRRLPPRELVRYFYRSTLRRAAENGLPRRSSQTPYEYRDLLAQRLPDAAPDIGALTEAFVEAEYSPRAIDQEHAQQARRPWERLRQRLRELLREQAEHAP
jgi:hypothetical protein